MKIVLAVSAVAAFGLFVAWVVAYSRRKEAEIAAAWMDFARRGGYRWSAASGPWYSRKSSRVAGEHAGIAFELDRYVVSTGKHRVVHSRARARPTRPLLARVVALRRSWGARFATWGRGTITTVGDTAFDQHMLVRCASQSSARAVLDDRVRKLLPAFARSPYFEAAGSDITLCWRGEERDASVLSAAVEIVVHAANALTRK